MIDVILADNTRPACGGPELIRYSAGGVIVALSHQGLDVRCVDLMSDRQGAVPDDRSGRWADVYCYAVFFGNKVNAFRHMQEARRSKNAPRLIIAFGLFASAFSDEIVSRGLADIVVTNDPEFVLPLVLKIGASDLSTVPNLCYSSDGKIIHTPKQSNHDLDQLPFIGPYLYSQGERPAIMLTARGCQYHCVFCDRNFLWGGGVRNRSIPHVLKEMKELIEGQQVKSIRFLDEDIAADHQRLAAICQGIRRLKGDYSWDCSACVDSVNQKALLLMKVSGCREVHLGVESASPAVLRKIGKTYGRQEILNAVRWAQEAKLNVEVMITIGNPGETDLDRNLTLSALNELGPDVKVITNRLVILPGTAFYRKGLKEGWYTQQSFFEDEGVIFYDEKERAHEFVRENDGR